MSWNQTYRNVLVHCDTNLTVVADNGAPGLLTHAVAIIGGQQRRGTLAEVKALIDRSQDNTSTALEHGSEAHSSLQLHANAAQ